MDKTIDILLATYNGEKYVQEQIESILNQSYQNIHLIISDDCSKDNTRKILKQYEQNERITIYYQPQNLGYIKNFEFLISKVENEIYMLSDQDDIWLSEKVEKTYETLKNENADFVFGDLKVVNQDLEEIYPSFNDYMLLSRKIKKYLHTKYLNYLYNCVTGCTIMSKKSFIKYFMPIPNSSKYVAHDYWMALMISLNGKLAYVPEKYILYRQHGDNEIGTEKISHKFKQFKQVRELFINVKLGVFSTYVENNDKFPKPIQELNQKALDYFNMLTKKKRFNFKDWKVFHTLYKHETCSYYVLNFVIMNMPLLGTGLFKIRYAVLKMLGKRK